MATFQIAIDAKGAVSGQRVFDSSAKKIVASSEKVDKKLAGVDKRFQKVGKSAGRVKQAVLGLVAGFSALVVIKSAIGILSEFEETMAIVGGVTRASVEELEKLEATARKLGATTRFSAKEAGEGLLFLARAGFEVEEAIAALPSTLDLAQAGVLDLGTAADIASNILSQFNLKAAETERIVDTLINTANSANTNVLQLAEAMKLVGPVAGALGISVEQTAAAIGVLGDSGIQASLAGTSLRGVLSSLLGATGKAKKALKALGLSLEEVDPTKFNLIEIFQKFRDANLDAASAVRIFGRRQAAGALIMARGVEKLELLTSANERAGGTAKEMSNIMSRTLFGAFKSLISVVQEAFLTIGDKGLGKALKDLVLFATDVIRALLGMDGALHESKANAVALATAISFIAKTTAVLIAFKLGAWMFRAAAGMRALTVAMAKNPITIVAVAISVLVGTLLEFVLATDDAVRGTSALNAELRGTELIVEQLLDAQAKLNRARSLKDLQLEVQANKQLASSLVELSVGLRKAELRKKKLFQAARGVREELVKLGPATRGLVLVTDELEEAMKLAGLESEKMGGKLERVIGAVAKGTPDMFPKEALQFANKAFLDYEELLRRLELRQKELGDVTIDSLKGQRSEFSKLDQLLKSFGEDTGEGVSFFGIPESVLRQWHEGQVALGKLNESLATNIRQEQQRGELIGLKNEERIAQEVLNSVREDAIEIAKIEGRTGADAVNRVRDILNIEKERITTLTGLIQRNEKLIERTRELRRVADAVGSAFERAFEDAIINAKSLRGVLQGLAKDLSRLALRELVTGPLRGLVGGLLTPSPGVTTVRDIPLSNPSFPDPSLAPEFQNLLGSSSTKGGTGTSGKGGTTINMTVITKDAASFRASKRQIRGDLVDTMRGAT